MEVVRLRIFRRLPTVTVFAHFSEHERAARECLYYDLPERAIRCAFFSFSETRNCHRPELGSPRPFMKPGGQNAAESIVKTHEKIFACPFLLEEEIARELENVGKPIPCAFRNIPRWKSFGNAIDPSVPNLVSNLLLPPSRPYHGLTRKYFRNRAESELSEPSAVSISGTYATW